MSDDYLFGKPVSITTSAVLPGDPRWQGGQGAPPIDWQREYKRLAATAKIGGSDVCATCNAHCIVIEDLEAERDSWQRIAEGLAEAVRWYAECGHNSFKTDDGCGRRARKVLAAFAAAKSSPTRGIDQEPVCPHCVDGEEHTLAHEGKP